MANVFLLWTLTCYERGCQRRTLVNRFASTLSWRYIEYLIFVSFPDIIRIFYTSLPTPFCIFTVVQRFALNTEILLFQNGIIIARYAYIFWIKNILSFEDTFWNLFLTICIKMVALLLQFSIVWLPGRQPIYYYLCTGTDPDIDIRPFNKLFNIQGLCLITVVVHIVAIVRIQLFRRGKVNPGGLQVDKSDDLTDLTTSICLSVVFSLNFVFLWIANALPGNHYNLYPYYYFEYFFRLCWPSLFSGLMMTFYICRHKEYRLYLKKLLLINPRGSQFQAHN